MDKYYMLNQVEKGTELAIAPDNVRYYDRPKVGTPVVDWNSIQFTINKGRFINYQTCNLGWELCSEKLQEIIVKEMSEDDRICWLPVTIHSLDVERVYYVLHHAELFDLLDRRYTHFGGNENSIAIRPALNLEAIGKHQIFTCKELKTDTIISQHLKDVIKELKCTGLEFLDVSVV